MLNKGLLAYLSDQPLLLARYLGAGFVQKKVRVIRPQSMHGYQAVQFKKLDILKLNPFQFAALFS
ncbi:MAG: hypothetical protein A2W85_10395 [Bacteroidetes bacterium GWF2_41_31]|nr:MAG: hypothetical protein A2W85_10395 [Bacteroidetes bacterium GWF2_41_31]